ncbi:MAG: DUF3387 domain-containing protein [Bacteroidales bacterium]|nr:DUF3387 domain-containing protein [Bacteroidales bacterium]
MGHEIQREPSEVLIKEDVKNFLLHQYKAEGLTVAEVEIIIRQLMNLPSTDLYESNKAIMKMLAENDYPPITQDEVYKEIFEQAENFKRYSIVDTR